MMMNSTSAHGRTIPTTCECRTFCDEAGEGGHNAVGGEDPLGGGAGDDGGGGKGRKSCSLEGTVYWVMEVNGGDGPYLTASQANVSLASERFAASTSTARVMFST